MSFQAIWNALKTKLDELITDSPQLVAAVYNYDIKVEDSPLTPCIIITPADGLETILDTAYNETIIPFYVRLLDQATDDRSAMENNIRSLADAVMEKIKDMAAVSYSNGATKRVTFTYKRGRTDTTEPMRVFELLVEFLAIEDK